MSIVLSKEHLSFYRELQSLTGENAMLCHQCRGCTLGCPSAYAMRMKPHELMRAIQLGLTQELYWSGAIWICLSCETCNTRCPQAIDILRIINGLREMAMSGKVDFYNPHPAIPALHRIFMAMIARLGRVHELGLALLSHLAMLTPFKDIDLFSPLLMRGKLWPIPRSSRGARELRQTMNRIRKLEGAK